MTDIIIHGDCLDAMGRMPDDHVDLIYADPPFNTGHDFGEFADIWHTDGTDSEITLAILKSILPFVESSHGDSGVAYLCMMTERLVEMHRILAKNGSIYVHCDPKISHLLRVIMDAIWGRNRFRNQITVPRYSSHIRSNQFMRLHDDILFYSKGTRWTWNPLYTPYDQQHIDTYFTHMEPDNGRVYRLVSLMVSDGERKKNPRYELLGITRHWMYDEQKMLRLIEEGLVIQTRPGTLPVKKLYLDEAKGKPLTDIWADVQPVPASGNSKTGYPTQKPTELLERIITASSNKNDLILDPFCGSGTTVISAAKLDRRFIGIDIGQEAIAMSHDRLSKTQLSLF